MLSVRRLWTRVSRCAGVHERLEPYYTHCLMGVGTAINVVAVLVGGGIGTVVGTRLPEPMRQTAMQAIGIVTLLVGVSNFLKLATTSTQTVPTLTLVTVL